MQFAVITDFATGEPETKPNILLVFGEHAREIISSDTALWLARTLTGTAPAPRTPRQLNHTLRIPHSFSACSSPLPTLV